jgi:hypothetical protein
MKSWTVIAQACGDIWLDYFEAETAKEAMLKMMVANPHCLLSDIVAVIEGKHAVRGPADFFEELDTNPAMEELMQSPSSARHSGY